MNLNVECALRKQQKNQSWRPHHARYSRTGFHVMTFRYARLGSSRPNLQSLVFLEWSLAADLDVKELCGWDLWLVAGIVVVAGVKCRKKRPSRYPRKLTTPFLPTFFFSFPDGRHHHHPPEVDQDRVGSPRRPDRSRSSPTGVQGLLPW